MNKSVAKAKGGVSMDFASILRVLALIGVYILNLLIYETIILVIWLGITFAAFRSSLPESKSNDVMRVTTIISFCTFVLICGLLLLGIGCIVPYPA